MSANGMGAAVSTEDDEQIDVFLPKSLHKVERHA